MTEPQELRSIDELFKNTFDNLPDTPAESGWDTPSDRVWQHVRDNIQTPRSGWNLQSLMLLTGFAIVLAVGLYFAFSTPSKVDIAPVNPTVAPITKPAETPAVMPEKSEPSVAVAPEVVHKQTRIPHFARPAVQKAPVENAIEPQTKVDPNRDVQHSSGAVPLPGSKSVIPNTTEERKAARARQLELRWKTPLKPLPVMPTEKVKD